MRRRAVAAHELVRRGTRAPVRGCGQGRAAHAADPQPPRASATDPLPICSAGSYYIEAPRTSPRPERTEELIDSHRRAGRRIAAVRSGFIQGQIEAAAFEWTKAVEAGRRPIVGVNTFVEGEGERIELHRIDPRVGAGAGRTHASCSSWARRELWRKRARRGCAGCARCREFCFPPMREALVVRCTVGEICGVLREEWGMYDRGYPT